MMTLPPGVVSLKADCANHWSSPLPLAGADVAAGVCACAAPASNRLAINTKLVRRAIMSLSSFSRRFCDEFRQLMGRHGRRRSVETLDLDQAGLRDAALAELRRADVERERVGIAVLLQRPVGR